LFALKFLPDQNGADMNGEGVRNEVKTWIKAGKHSNIVRVYDGFIYGRYLVIVSEYVEGGSLRDWLEANQKKAPSLEKAVEMLRDILRGLSHLHTRRIIHRDLKPENILLEDEVPKITDFGVSRVVETFSQSATRRLTNGAGSPLYMPPEAFGENTPMPQLDIWSAGVMFYEMLSGGWPFTGNSMYALFAEITGKDPRPLPEDVPHELQAIVMTALLKDTAQRFQTAEQMREAIDKAWSALLQRQQSLSETISDENWLEREAQKRAAEETERRRKLPSEAQATKEPLSAKDFFKRGDKCYKKKDYDGAIQNHNKAIELNPRYADAYSNRGNSYYMKGDYDQAFVDYNKAIALNPQLAHAYLNRGDIYYKEKEYDQALIDYNKAIQIDPQYAAAYYKRGEFYASAYYYYTNERDSANYDRAVRDFSKAIKLNPRYAPAYVSRGYAYYYTGNYDQAFKDYDKAIELNQQSAAAYHNRATVYRCKGDYDRAIADYNKAVELSPHDADAYWSRGNVYMDTGDYDQARIDFNKAIELNPQHTYAYSQRARAYVGLSKKAKVWADRREFKKKAKTDRLKYEELYKESKREK